MEEVLRIVGEVEKPRIGDSTLKLEITKKASDILCVAMARLVASWNEHGDEDLPIAEQLQKDAVKVWERFRP